jgi:hypothetical protein
VLDGEDDARHWEEAREFAWLPVGHGLIKVAMNPARLPDLERAAGGLHPAPMRHYSVGGNVCWLGWPNSLGETRADALLKEMRLPGVPVLGSFENSPIGHHTGDAFARRLLTVLDPEQRLQPHAA